MMGLVYQERKVDKAEAPKPPAPPQKPAKKIIVTGKTKTVVKL